MEPAAERFPPGTPSDVPRGGEGGAAVRRDGRRRAGRACGAAPARADSLRSGPYPEAGTPVPAAPRARTEDAMRALRLVALSDDGKSLVLSTDGPDGEERFELPIDERVRAAARGDARLGAIEDLANTLPPRVIQARIRAGETPEQVALASGTRIDRIMRFAHPVLQERGRIAEQSLRARVRLSEGVPAGTLEQFMGERLRLLGADLDVVRWDAARSADGTWTVSGAWNAGAAG